MSHSKLRRDRRGTAAVEFALIAPIFILIYMVGADVFMLARNRFRVDQAAVQGTQVVAQYTTLYDDDFTTTIFPVIQAIAGNGTTSPLVNPNQVACAVTISGLDYPPVGSARAGLLSIVWRKSYGNGTCTANRVGAFNTTTMTPTAPSLNGYTPPTGVPLVIVEVGSQYNLLGMSAARLGSVQSQYSVAMAMPRQRALPPVTTGNRP